jgi:hypothetical protein
MFINIEVPRLVKLRCHPERNVTYYNAELKSYFLPFFIYNNNKKSRISKHENSILPIPLRVFNFSN